MGCDALCWGSTRQGAEFWFNPEIDQGFGLSNAFGVAGYLSGDAYKVGKSDAYFLIQRAFLRQTIDLGGETEKLDLSRSQPTRRHAHL